MLNLSSAHLAKHPAMFRYLYFLATSFRLTTYKAWKSDGEPNPFVKKTYRHNGTHQVEFTDIFEDVLTQRN